MKQVLACIIALSFKDLFTLLFNGGNCRFRREQREEQKGERREERRMWVMLNFQDYCCLNFLNYCCLKLFYDV